MPESKVACDCPRDHIYEDERIEKDGGIWGVYRVQIHHRPGCPAGALPPLGVCVSDTSGVTGKVGG